jgi:DNA polymerase (family 10)
MPMPVHNADVAAIFDEMADLLEIRGENPFRVRAYRNAARTLRDLGRDAKDMIEAGEDLSRLPGIGKDLAGKIRQVIETGRLPALAAVEKKVPPELVELLRLPGLGPRRVQELHRRLHVKSLAGLAAAARARRLRDLPGFGKTTERKILEAIEARSSRERRFRLAAAAPYAEGLAAYLREVPGVENVVVAGSFRRFRETVGDLDILVTASRKSPVLKRLSEYDEVREVRAQGATRSTVTLRSGIQVDVRAVAPESFGAALVYFTGSKAHNIAIRRIAVKKGLKINEYGVFRQSRRIAGKTEESVYRTLGLSWIPPELRENRGEIEAAASGALPHLVETSDLRGDLHAHSVATDGRNSVREMAVAAREFGLEYLAMTEHSRRLTMAKGLDPKRLAAEGERIDRLNEELEGITLLKGIEVDILEDGRLDLPDSALARLDVVVGAVHGKFGLPRARQTERILRAMDNRYFTVLAHPTGRLLGERDAYDVDMERIIRHAAERGCFLEVNAHPERLDLLDTQCQMARAEGVLIAVDSDAHSIVEFGNLRYGVGQARRGWLEKKDVANTRTLRQLRKLLAAMR